MVSKVDNTVNFAIPEEIIKSHYCEKLPSGFPVNLTKGGAGMMCNPHQGPTLYTAHLPEVLDWLHGLEKPKALENEPCGIPVLLFDREMSTENLLFH